MTDLASRRSKPIPAGSPALSRDDVDGFLKQVRGWELSESGLEIRRAFAFRNYHETMAFVNAVAWIAHAEDHHPDLEVGYNRCVVRWSTHSVGGLSVNDFIGAAKIDALGVPTPQ